jgi:hypothetical protein
MAALQSFCAEYAPDEMSFDDWCATEERLDLTLYLTLTCEEAQRGGSRDIKYSRTETEKLGANETKKTRIPSTCSVSFPAGIESGAVLEIEGAGDRCGKRSGNLRIIVRVK